VGGIAGSGLGTAEMIVSAMNAITAINVTARIILVQPAALNHLLLNILPALKWAIMSRMKDAIAKPISRRAATTTIMLSSWAGIP
jgi:hypothetical protein